MLVFTFETLGEASVSAEQLLRLKRAGLIREPVRNLIGDSYVLGKIVSLVEREKIRDISYDRVLRAAKRMTPPTSVEKKAIQYAQEHAGEYIRSLSDDMVREVGTLAARGKMTALRAVQEGVSTSIAERETVSQLKTRLFHSIDDKYNDWQRIAHTEMNTAIQQGIYNDIREKSDEGENQRVYKRPNPDACQHCKRVYLSSDGITPKVFRLRELYDNNIGVKAKNWRATIGSVHPWCNCQLLVLPDGYDFEKQRVIVDGFSKDSRKFKRGEILSATEFEKLSEDQKKKVGWDAILTHTGETARPSVD